MIPCRKCAQSTRTDKPARALRSSEVEAAQALEDWIRPHVERRARRERARESVVEFLQPFPWEWFATFTFKPRADGRHHRIEFCRRHVNRFLAELSARIYGKRWRDRGTGLFGLVVYEPHKKGSYHAHALLAGTNGYRRMDVVDECWNHPVLGMARVHAVKDEHVEYVCKYVAKAPGLWELFGARWWDDQRDLVEDLVGNETRLRVSDAGAARHGGRRWMATRQI